jgi:hypothetical protein
MEVELVQKKVNIWQEICNLNKASVQNARYFASTYSVKPLRGAKADWLSHVLQGVWPGEQDFYN